VLAAALLGVAANSTVASANYIPSSSMEPTLVLGERVMVNKLDR
jgi:signal peptidase I